jgi:D-glycero-alpha-D-manno-heptose-7-phosphate kinase
MRLGFAGGGTDIDAFAEKYVGFILNATICKYVTTTINDEVEKNKIVFYSVDMETKEIYNIDDEINYNGSLDMLKAAYKYSIKHFNNNVRLPLSIATFCDAPTGSGLGTSSTLMVSLMHAFIEYFNIGMGEYELASLAFQIERISLGLAGGKQDQYAAAFGGFNFMEFYSQNRVIVNPLRIKEEVIAELESNILLFYSGVSRESGNIITEQKNNIRNGIVNSIDGLLELKQQALNMKESILTGNFKGIIDALNKGWTAKKLTASKVSSERLDEIYVTAIKSGALAGKISGAGGGGFFMFIVPPTERKKVIDALSKYNGEYFNCVIDNRGSLAWTIK